MPNPNSQPKPNPTVTQKCPRTHGHTHTHNLVDVSLAVTCKHLWHGLLTSMKDSAAQPNSFLSLLPPFSVVAWLG